MKPTDLGNEPTNVWALMNNPDDHNGIETITTGLAITGGVLVKNVTIIRENKGGYMSDFHVVSSSESTVFIPGVELVRNPNKPGYYEINYMPGSR